MRHKYIFIHSFIHDDDRHYGGGGDGGDGHDDDGDDDDGDFFQNRTPATLRVLSETCNKTQ